MTRRIILSTAAGLDKRADHGNIAIFGLLPERTYGSFTLHARKGNPEPRYWFDPRTNTSWNSIGLENQSLQRFLDDDLPKIVELTRATGIRIRISLAPLTVGDLRTMLQMIVRCPLKKWIYEIEINAACPNHRKSEDLQPVLAYNPAEIRHLLSECQGFVQLQRLALKIAPKTPDATLVEIVKACEQNAIDAIVSGNTLGSSSTVYDIQRLSQPTGGMAGGQLFPIAIDQYARMQRIVAERKSTIEIVACGGIMDPSKAIAYADLGATRLQVATYYAEFGATGLQDMQVALT